MYIDTYVLKYYSLKSKNAYEKKQEFGKLSAKYLVNIATLDNIDENDGLSKSAVYFIEEKLEQGKSLYIQTGK